MKRVILCLMALSLACTATYAQEEAKTITNKKGYRLMPEAGDICLSVDATPFLEYAGNLLSQYGNDAPYFLFSANTPQTLTGKYMASEKMAYRGGITIGMSRYSNTSANFTDPDKEDKTTTSKTAFGLEGGVEFYRPVKNRLRGYYGGVLGFDITPHYMGKRTFENAVTSTESYTEKGGNETHFYAAGLIGVEYFIAPKIALGGEFILGPGFTSTSDRIHIQEGQDDIITENKSSALFFQLQTAGYLVLNFYF